MQQPELVHIEVDDGEGGRGFLDLTGGWHGESNPIVVPLERAKTFNRADAEWVLRKLPAEFGAAAIVPIEDPADDEWTMTTHVAAAQVHPGSRGRSRSLAHIQRAPGAGEFVAGRLRVPEGRTLCKKPKGWYERPAEDEPVCTSCTERAVRHGIPIGVPAAAGEVAEQKADS